MSRSGEIVSSATVDMDRCERDFFDVMKAETGLPSDGNLLRAALFHFARHLDVPVSIGTFRIRKHGGMKGRLRSAVACETCGQRTLTRERG